MNTGMLWFDNDPKTDIDEKIGKAITYYQKKYGQTPNLCFVHPTMLVQTPIKTRSVVEVRTNKMVLPNHFWLGSQA
ncbi:MAG: hypothetical protein HGA53_05715 [Anaerolineaceae bacterium]|nr:hypothetical protein [Anaerolineaceae bacterium]